MRSNPIPLIAMGLFFALSVNAQDRASYELLLKSGSILPEKNISPQQLEIFNGRTTKLNGKSLAILQFDKMPTALERQSLLLAGIELLEYIPNNAYTAIMQGTITADQLRDAGARSLVELSAIQKMRPELARGDFPAWAVKEAGTVDVWIRFPSAFSYEEVRKELQRRNFQLLSDETKQYGVLSLRVKVQRLGELALLPFILYVESAPAPDKELNFNSMYASRGNVLKAPLSVGGKALDGTGVTIGVGDNGDFQTHLDFTQRLINRVGAPPANHAAHVAGTVGGNGNIKNLYKGYATKSTLVGQFFSGVIINAPAYSTDHGMVITNNSYGEVTDDCAYNGLYDSWSVIIDQQAFDMPELNNVFAAGNDGAQNCSPYATGFKNVLGGYQSSKNAIIVGSVNLKNGISGFSSRGPVRDGRTKPDITAMGELVASTWSYNSYSYNNGTSMAAPGVSGGLALLVQQYRNQHSANPKSALMKAVLCNGANDQWHAGPDFSYGHGTMNLHRSSKMIENQTYFTGALADNGSASHGITVPANTAQLKVLLYWHDPPAALLASKTLVNDLDLEVNTPLGVAYPFLLDTLPGNVDNPPTFGADHKNNIEQIIINDPTPGAYSLNVLAPIVAQNPTQEYFVVYDIIPRSIVLTSPVGSEGIVPTPTIFDSLFIHWDYYGTPASSFTVEFTTDVPAESWTQTVAGTQRVLGWHVPANLATDQARIKITETGSGFTQTSFPFVITDMPIDSLTPNQCEGYIQLGWRAVPEATDYEVMMLQGDEMVVVATTTQLNYTFSGLSKDSVYWVCMRPRINGNRGMRANAVSSQPTGICSGTLSDNDLAVDSLLSPSSSGRMFTNSQLGNSVPITIRIKNLDNAISSATINVSYSINGGAPVNETINVPAADIPASSFIDYTFTQLADLSAVGTYSIVATATKATDPVTANNSITRVVKQLANSPILVTDLPWLDDLESAGIQSSTTRQMGLSNRDRYDFVTSTIFGRVRTFVNSGIAYSGTRAITLDATIHNVGTTDSLTGTFNLATFNPTSEDIRLDFRYKNHGQEANDANAVWIRGSENDTWIKMYDLYVNQNPADGSFKLTGSLELRDSLDAHGQDFTTSFQVRIGQWGEYMAADNNGWAGYTIDNVRLYAVTDDIQTVSIDAPASTSCGLDSDTPVTVTVRNTSANQIDNIPIILRVDGVIVATETISEILGNSAEPFTFLPGANLAAPGTHLIEVWVDLPSDNFADNDTARLTINNLPLINTFPYLENFESGNGNWYTDASGSTWEYGTPQSPRINRAASGTKAWKTERAGYYSNMETSYLYSPCFDITGLTNPTLSFSLSLHIEDCGASFFCDGAWVEYSTNGGTSWAKLGAVGQGTNWYNRNYAGNHMWSQQNYQRWHVATIPLPVATNIRFRFVFSSDQLVTMDGIGVDDIHIYSNPYGIYETTGTSPVVNQPTVNGTGWIDFQEPAVTGKLIASINPLGQDLGSTNVQSYIHTGPVRINSDQFYHNRNITIKPTTVNLPDSAMVRFYFLDSETELLINATGCSYCYKPSMAYELGVTKYSDPADPNENGTLDDNMAGLYSFINAGKAVKVPFDKGYYAEFKVKDFSEFWLNNGGFDLNTPLPVELMSFTAKKRSNNDVLAEWKTATESNVDRYEVEVARSEADYLADRFVKLREVHSRGNTTTIQTYQFTDTEAGKKGTRYYRLKIVDIDDRSSYSAIRPVQFDQLMTWHISPNPSHGIFNLDFQVNDKELLKVRVFDVHGRMIRQYEMRGDGFQQRLVIDLSKGYSNGLYLVEAGTDSQKQVFRVVKQ